MQQPDAREDRKTCYKLLVTCTQTCSNPGCSKEYSVCQRADHLRGHHVQGAAVAVPNNTGPVAQETPGVLTVTTTCPYCGHVIGVPVFYSGHEEQVGDHETDKGSPVREETGQ
uniref:Uncharacterized protein n=1 Tax=Branchiostoma floridae TaxID=7739 RepID=C3Y7B7_BRAFL|eukprot:XP_002607735.1 hypothetical protein BRAFLDRAFT_82818 [Branchiostoma floridae]